MFQVTVVLSVILKCVSFYGSLRENCFLGVWGGLFFFLFFAAATIQCFVLAVFPWCLYCNLDGNLILANKKKKKSGCLFKRSVSVQGEGKSSWLTCMVSQRSYSCVHRPGSKPLDVVWDNKDATPPRSLTSDSLKGIFKGFRKSLHCHARFGNRNKDHNHLNININNNNNKKNYNNNKAWISFNRQTQTTSCGETWQEPEECWKPSGA